MTTIKKLTKEEKATAVARLKLAQEEEHKRDFQTGMADGRNWAIQRGDCGELEALDWVAGNYDPEVEDKYLWNQQAVLARMLARHHGERFGKELSVAELQRTLFPPNRPHTFEYVNGFQIGATLAWDEIKPLLKAGAGSEGAGAA